MLDYRKGPSNRNALLARAQILGGFLRMALLGVNEA